MMIQNKNAAACDLFMQELGKVLKDKLLYTKIHVYIERVCSLKRKWFHTGLE